MERTAVESSNVVSIGYDSEHQVMEVEFKGGRVYHYVGIDEETWEVRESYDSIGKYIASGIKPHFAFGHGEFEPEDEEEACDEWEHCALTKGHDGPCQDIAGENAPEGDGSGC